MIISQIIRIFLDKKELFLWGNINKILKETSKNNKRKFLYENPEKIILNPRDKLVSKIACTSNICLILTSTGCIYIMGIDKKESGLFGFGKELQQAKKPILLEYFCRNNIFITDIAISDNVAIGISGIFFRFCSFK